MSSLKDYDEEEENFLEEAREMERISDLSGEADYLGVEDTQHEDYPYNG